MILSCPSCATQYAIDEAQLGPSGRTVRCSACKTTWRAERFEDPIELPPVAEPPLARPEDLKTVKAEKLPKSYRAMQDYKKRMKAVAAQAMVWGGLAAGFALVMTLGYAMRVDIVQMFPRTAGAYAMVGLRVNATHLEVPSFTAKKTMHGGRFVVAVEAQVHNLSDKAVAVPPIRVKLLDSTMQQYDTALIPPSGLVMAPNAVRTVTFDVPDPKNLSASLDLQFDLVAMKTMKAQRIAEAPAPVSVTAAGSETAVAEADMSTPVQEAVPETTAFDTDSPPTRSREGNSVAADAQTPATAHMSPPVLRPAISPSSNDLASQSPPQPASHLPHGQS